MLALHKGDPCFIPSTKGHKIEITPELRDKSKLWAEYIISPNKSKYVTISASV